MDGGVAAGLMDLFVGDGGFVDAEDDVVSESACDGDKDLLALGITFLWKDSKWLKGN